MKRKVLLIIASILMIVIGVLRGFGGMALLLKGNNLETNSPIIAGELQIKLVSSGLLLVCILLIYSAINLLMRAYPIVVDGNPPPVPTKLQHRLPPVGVLF